MEKAITGTDDDIVASAEPEVVLRIDVCLDPGRIHRIVVLTDIQERLHLQRRAVAAGARPAAEHVVLLRGRSRLHGALTAGTGPDGELNRPLRLPSVTRLWTITASDARSQSKRTP